MSEPMAPSAAEATEGMREAFRDLTSDRALQMLMVVVGLGAAALLAAERNGPGLIRTAEDALWNALTTVAGVGESGCPPMTSAGRAVGSFLVIVGNPLYDRARAALGDQIMALTDPAGRAGGPARKLMDQIQALLPEV